MNEDDTITIFGIEDTEDRGLFDRLRELRFGREEVSAEALKDRLETFLNSMQQVIQSVPQAFGKYQLDTVALAVEISAKGQVSLLGMGAEMAGKGGLTFTLKRADAP